MSENEIVDLDKYPLHMRMDYQKRNENIQAGYKLCGRCEGTGNELYSMYRKCTVCRGTGQAQKGGKQ